MKSKRFRVTIVYLFVLFALVFSWQTMAQASALPIPKDPICQPLRLECFPLPGSPRREKLIHEKMGGGKEFEAPYHKVHKLPDSEKESFSARQQNYPSLDCSPSNAEELTQQLGETLDDK